MAKMLINGESVAAISNEEYPVYNPANGEVVDTAPKGDGKRQFKLHHSNAKLPCGDSKPTEVGFAMMCRDF